MSESGESSPHLETSVPADAVPLESILCTEELRRRPSRTPDYQKENRALVALMSTLADSPNTVFETLVYTILDITQSHSAGVRLTDERWQSAGCLRQSVLLASNFRSVEALYRRRHTS